MAATTLTIQVLADVAKAVEGINSVDKKTSSLGSTMKAAGGAIAGAFSTEKIISFAQTALAAGMDARRAMKNVTVVFGEASAGVKAWGETAAGAFGMTTAEAEKAAAKVGVALTGFGMSQQAAATACEALVQRSAELAKVLGVDQAEVLARVEAAMRGRTAGLKDYGVQVAKGADATAILNGFLDQTAQYAGQADTPMGTFKATMSDLTAQIGMALIPVLNAVLPLFQAVADWATQHHAAFVAIVIVIGALALVFSIAAAAAGVFALASLGALWPILAVVAGVAALVAVVILVIKYWGDLVGWFHTAAGAVMDFVGRFQILLLLFGGPLAAALVGLRHFSEIWGGIRTAVDAVASAIDHVLGLASKAASAVGGLLSHIPGLHAAAGGGAPAGVGVSPYGVSPYAPVVFAPQITFTGDVGDPILAGRRIVSALETWTAANGRRRLASLVGPT
jgi:hypothetical protein